MIATLKYIIWEINGIPTPTIFPVHVQHDSVSMADSSDDGNEGEILSAGFCTVGPDGATAFGASESLGRSSRPEDGQIIWRFLGGAR